MADWTEVKEAKGQATVDQGYLPTRNTIVKDHLREVDVRPATQRNLLSSRFTNRV